MFTLKPSNSKITEKLKILNERTNSVLIQVDYLKNVLLSDDGYFNRICSEAAYESSIKLLLKKFPSCEIKSNRFGLESLTGIHAKILHELSFHYYTLVDVLEIKDNLMDLFGQISAFQYQLDINLNFDMTRAYLDLVVNYSTLMIILSGITQIKTILGLFNFAMVTKFDVDERFYHRLCERLVEKHKDGSTAEVHSELNPYSKTIVNALNSLSGLVQRKQLPVAEWADKKLFQLSQDTKLTSLINMNPTLLLPYTRLERWVIFGYLAVYPEIIKSPSISQLWRSVLAFSGSVVLFRSELLQIHPFVIKFLEGQKGYGKLVSVVKEAARQFASDAVPLHRSRRNFLRMAMRHQLQTIMDMPGNMAPNALMVCYTLASATDELYWLVRHSEMGPSKKHTNFKPDDFTDPLVPEFMHQIEELRYIVRQFDVMTLFYRSVLIDIDLPVLRNFVDSLKADFTDDDRDMLDSFIDRIASLADEPVSDEPLTNESLFDELRLDWFRLQTNISFGSSGFEWDNNMRFVQFVNSMVVHTHFVDNLDRFVDKFSSLGFLYFHRNKLNDWFDKNLKLAVQHRYVIVFPRVCGHFIGNCKHDVPEDFNSVLRVSTDMAHCFLSRICQELCKLLVGMIKTHFDLNLKLQPVNAVELYNLHHNRRQKDSADTAGHGNKGYNTSKTGPPPLPGSESKRKNLADSTDYDRQLLALNQLASGLNTRPLPINNRLFAPTNYLMKELTKFLNDKFVSLIVVQIKREKIEITGCRRPSEMIILIKECMSLVSKISDFVNINTPKLFIDVFLNQSLNKDNSGHGTLTEMYCNWYVDYVLIQPHILHTPLLKCFLTIIPQSQKEASTITINVEEYTDIEELRALVEIIGPYGMIALNEKIMGMIVKNVSALRRFVQRNRSTLIELNVINLDYNKVKKLLLNMEDVDDFCQQWKQMGILFAFKDLCREAVQDVVRKAMPFLRATVDDLQQDFNSDPTDQMSSVSERENPMYSQFRNHLIINELCQGFGLKTKVDSSLFNIIESLKQQQQQIQADQMGNIDQTEDQSNDLLVVAISYLLPRLVGSNFYHVEYESLDQSAHCTAYAIKELMYVFFFKYGDERLDNQIRKFIALTSSNLLRLGLESSTSNQSNKEEAVLIHNRDSIYIFFDFIIQTLDNVPDSFYEECFPYALIRQAYHNVVKLSRHVITKAAHPTDASSKAALEACKFTSK